MSTSSMTAAMTIAARVASGSFSKSPVRNSRVTMVSAAAVRAESCERAPAEPFTAVFERLPLTTMPLVSPAPRLETPETQQLAVGVDVVARPSRRTSSRPRAPRRSRRASRPRWQRAGRRTGRPETSGQAEVRQSGVDVPDDLEAVVVEAEERHGGDADQGDDQGCRAAAAGSASTRRAAPGSPTPTETVSRSASSRWVRTCHAFSKKLPLPLDCRAGRAPGRS